MKYMKKIIAILLMFTLCVGFAACQKSGPKSLTFEVWDGDQLVQKYEITTEKELLSEALQEAGVVKMGDYTTFGGITAALEKGEGWYILRNGEDYMMGWEAPFADGDYFKLTKTYE
jgi:hypothetical protein